MNIQNSSFEERFVVSNEQGNLVMKLIKDGLSGFLCNLSESHPEVIASFIQSEMIRTIEAESNQLCNNKDSPFKIKNVKDADKISFKNQLDESMQKAPLLTDVLFT